MPEIRRRRGGGGGAASGRFLHRRSPLGTADVQKGGRVNRTLHVLKGLATRGRRNFQRWGKKSRVNFHRPFTSVIPRRPSFPLRLSGLFFLPRMSIRFSATFFFLFSTKSSRSKIEESRIWVAKAFSYDKKGVDIFIICCRDETNNTRILNFFVWTNYRHLPVATKKIREYVYIYLSFISKRKTKRIRRAHTCPVRFISAY